MACLAVLLSGCVARRGPEIPSNAAGWFVGAVMEADSELVEARLCEGIGSEVDLDNPATFGELSGFIEMLIGDSHRKVGWRGGDSEYTAAEELRSQTDHAWTEMELRSGGELIGVWRLHMVREGSLWTACGAERRI